jgi:DNA-binding IclR family transcriptional regulator
VAVAVLDHAGHPVAAISTTFPHRCAEIECGQTWPEAAAETEQAAAELTARIGGG